jgi:hypothetical protein
MSDNSNGVKAEESVPTFTSRLRQGRQRFLAHVMEHSLHIGRRSTDDFIRHFPPEAIMKGLENQPNLRANILAHTTGLKHKIATKKSWQSAADDLRIALEEKETDSASVIAAFEPDDRVRYLDDKKLWAFIIEGEFWATSPKQEAYAKAKVHVAYMLDRALVDELVTHRDIVEGITVEHLVMCLPKNELGKIIEGALSNAHRNAPFTEQDLLSTRPPRVLVEYVPLSLIYDSVIEPKIARAHAYVAAAPAPEPSPEQPAEAPPAEAAPSEENEVWVDAPEGAGGSDDEISDDDFAMP